MVSLSELDGPTSSAALAAEAEARRAVRWRTLAYFLVALTGFGLVGLVPLWRHDQQVRHDLVQSEAFQLRQAAASIELQLGERIVGLRTVSRAPTLVQFASQPEDPARRVAVERLFHALGSSVRAYDQIRLIDRQGREVVRVDFRDGATRTVPPEGLQDKSDRPYVQHGLRLLGNELHISPLELNQERGQIEQPLLATLRLVTPVIDERGQAAHLLVYNLIAERMLYKFRHLRSQLDGFGHALVDGEGYWISHPDPTLEWGRERGAPEDRFGHAAPQAWAAFREARYAQFDDGQALHLMETVRLRDALAKSTEVDPTLLDALRPWAKVDLTGGEWRLIASLPLETLHMRLFLGHPSAPFFLVLAALGVGFWSYVFAELRDKRVRMQRAQAELQAHAADLYENAPCGYHSVDAQGRVVRINRTELRWLGYEPHEVLGRPLQDFLTPASVLVFRDTFPRFMREGQLNDLHLDFLRKDGSVLHAGVTATVVRDEAGHFLYSRSTLVDIQDRLQHEALLSREARTDFLTQVANRRAFMDTGAKEVERVRRQGLPLSVLMLDADHFKRINDRHGHEVGDRVLVNIANVLFGLCRVNDVIGRLGGEEFAILLPGTGSEGALALAERVRTGVAAATVDGPGGQTVRCTVSVGVTSLVPDASVAQGSQALTDLLRQADEALYNAKAQGRDQVVAWSAGTGPGAG